MRYSTYTHQHKHFVKHVVKHQGLIVDGIRSAWKNSFLETF